MFLTTKLLPILILWYTDKPFLCRNGGSYSWKKRKLVGRRRQQRGYHGTWRNQAIGENYLVFLIKVCYNVLTLFWTGFLLVSRSLFYQFRGEVPEHCAVSLVNWLRTPSNLKTLLCIKRDQWSLV